MQHAVARLTRKYDYLLLEKIGVKVLVSFCGEEMMFNKVHCWWFCNLSLLWCQRKILFYGEPILSTFKFPNYTVCKIALLIVMKQLNPYVNSKKYVHWLSNYESTYELTSPPDLANKINLRKLFIQRSMFLAIPDASESLIINVNVANYVDKILV